MCFVGVILELCMVFDYFGKLEVGMVEVLFVLIVEWVCDIEEFVKYLEVFCKLFGLLVEVGGWWSWE